MDKIRYRLCADPDSIPAAYNSRYPPVAVSAKNETYAKILTPDLASAASEMTTVHQYLYQSWTISGEAGTIRRVIQRITVVEQRHFSIIGRLITLLGGSPECRSAEKSSFWNGSMVNYSRNLKELLSANAQAEQFAAQVYADQAKEIEDPLVSRMLARLSLDEKLHHKIFSDFLAQL